jgi:hypothetical protein
MAGSDEDLSRSRRPDAEDQKWSSTGRVLGGRTIRRSGDTMCGLCRTQGDEEHDFLGLASKPWSGGFPGTDLKNSSSGLVIWASKSPRQFLDLGLKTKRVTARRVLVVVLLLSQLISCVKTDFCCCVCGSQFSR